MNRVDPVRVLFVVSRYRPLAIEQMRRERLTQQQIADKLNVSQATVSGDVRDLNINSDIETPETVTNSRGQERPATYRKPEPPHTVNTDTGEVIDKATGEVITRLPGQHPGP